MSNNEDPNAGKKPFDRGKQADNPTPLQANPEQDEVEPVEKEKDFLGEVAGNIEEGAKRVGEKATELSDKIVGKLKKGWSHVYEAGAKVVDELSQAAQDYAEKYKAESEIKKLEGEKDKLVTRLGQSIFRHHFEGGKFSESFFNKKAICDQFDEIEMLDKKIIETGQQLDKEKE
jgi:hypothetical protein